VAPFRGVRYNPHRASGIANVTSPPYDVIGAATLDDLLQADPHNVVRLILPRSAPRDADSGPGPDPNQEAAQRLRSWRAAGILAPDPGPALYVYQQSAPGPAPNLLQRGVIALVGVGDPAESGIVPHEDVMPGPVRDRRDLMAATRANLEPIFLVYDGGGQGSGGQDRAGQDRADQGAAGRSATSALADEVAGQGAPLVTAVTPDGITHRLWRVADPAAHALVAADLAGRTALIADGHHRYAAYRGLQDQMRERGHGPGPWDYGLAYLVDDDAYAPRLGAIHRVLPRLRPDDAARLAAGAFTVRELPAGGLDAALGHLRAAGDGEGAFLLAGPPGGASGTSGTAGAPRAGRAARYWLVERPDRALVAASMPPASSPRWRRLDAAILQQLLMARLWGIHDSERGVLVRHDAGDAVQCAVESGGVAVIMRPCPFGVVRDLALHGERVPRKSTSFGPKPRSGLVLRGFDD
jgi:uncharacterized protein (DUF1015 family)